MIKLLEQKAWNLLIGWGERLNRQCSIDYLEHLCVSGLLEQASRCAKERCAKEKAEETLSGLRQAEALRPMEKYPICIYVCNVEATLRKQRPGGSTTHSLYLPLSCI